MQRALRVGELECWELAMRRVSGCSGEHVRNQEIYWIFLYLLISLSCETEQARCSGVA
jgi:hypothetical protein